MSDLSQMYRLVNVIYMTDAEDRALGAAIRRRRGAMGMSQKDVADRLGVAGVVLGRVELGTRPCRATELRDIARILGTTADDLLRGSTPVSPEEVVERAAVQRDAAANALSEYGSAVLDAIAAVDDAEYGAQIDGHDMDGAAGVADYLRRSAPSYTGLTVPADLVPVMRGVIDALAAALPVYGRGGNGDG